MESRASLRRHPRLPWGARRVAKAAGRCRRRGRRGDRKMDGHGRAQEVAMRSESRPSGRAALALGTWLAPSTALVVDNGAFAVIGTA